MINGLNRNNNRMKTFHKSLFIIGHKIVEWDFHSNYKQLLENQWKSYSELKEIQEIKLRNMIHLAYESVPYYRKLFNELNLKPEDIQEIEDLMNLPILTKEMIKKNWEDFKPVNLNKLKFYNIATGGSSGTTLKYRISKHQRFLAWTLAYRGWGYAGYELSDKMIFFGGSRLGNSNINGFTKKVHEIWRNIQKLSSFDMSEKEMQDYVNIINSFKPKYIRAYPSSIHFLSNWIKENNIKIYKPEGIFTTSEKLYPNMREEISHIFNCDVYDGYGLGDGALSAYECSEHSGLHIDPENSIMEVVDKNGNQLEDGEGRILATSLNNYPMPFIRYDTGDVGTITNETCNCGRGYKLLKEIVGRSVDILVTPEGKNVHGWFFLYIFWKHCSGIKEYQVIQKTKEIIEIKIIPENNFDDKQLNRIKEIVRNRSEGWYIQFIFVDNIEKTKAGKFKYIINEMNEKQIG